MPGADTSFVADNQQAGPSSCHGSIRIRVKTQSRDLTGGQRSGHARPS